MESGLEDKEQDRAGVDSGDEIAAGAAIETAAPEKESIGVGWLLAAALALIAVPVLIGFIFLTGGDDSSTSSDGAGAENSDGGMGGGVGAGDVGGGLPIGVSNFSEIQASDIVVDFDGSGSGAVLRVTTSIEVACAVAYGPTTALGSIATDTDMAGGGHTDHAPLMRDLTADTGYFYRISAIGPDGRLYQSELLQFTFTPESNGAPAPEVSAAPAVQPPAPNVAGMASVRDVSSEFSASFGGKNAIDGDLATEWSSAGDGDDAYIVLDFGEDMLVSGVGFRTREMTDGTSITTSFTVTADGKTYGPFDAGLGLAVALADFRGQVIRFDVETSTGGNTGAVEVEVYGETDM
jgi:hypothetical protein